MSTSTLLPPGAGFHVAFIQVRDAAGNRSRIMYQAVLVRARRGAFAHARWTWGSSRADRHVFGRGSQFINYSAFDHRRDVVRCGPGIDVVLLQREDVAARDCEVVRRVVQPKR